ncbi:MAG: alanine--tRNA ligase, partial [Ignavibacteriaceae bacterium]
MTSSEIRQQFFDFFERKKHKIVQSSPVVPFDDPTLLFTNAGMNQFKDVFLGTGTREYSRAADTQKCIRVSGKHNDLEEVGHDTYHHTFFEMLGNWSFGDYYKKEAIQWAWELLTEVWNLPKERLWATVYRNDDEALELWKSQTDINPDHVLKFDEKDNFWEMGETGPCGPCSEIHINLGDDFNNPKYVNAGSPECIEIWNLVFIQFNGVINEEGLKLLVEWDMTPMDKRDKLLYSSREKIIKEFKKYEELPAKHIDTGMGFERVCAILQKKNSNYDTDIFMPIIKAVEKISGIKYEKEDDQISMRVIADHIRTLTFAIADGAVPGNDGRGYVLRRILRRAARYGRKLLPDRIKKIFLYELVDVLVENMGMIFPEIKEKKEYIKKIIKAEEESFNATLDRGIATFNETIKEIFRDSIQKERPNKIIKSIINSPNEMNLGIESEDLNGQSIRLFNLDDVDSDTWKKYLKNRPIISGEDVFKLYDTFGFPVDLTKVMAQEKGFTIDEAGFEKLMEAQRKRGKEASKEKFASINVSINDLNSFEIIDEKKSEFIGYDELKSSSKIIGHKKENGNDLIILNKTPFYVEAGGQIDVLGNLIINNSSLNVIDVTKVENNTIHIVENESNKIIKPGEEVIAEVDKKRRWDIMRNHSATHFLHAALRKILGTHVHQAGSYVGPDRLRFDFTHFAKLSETKIKEIEALVNEELRRNILLQHHRNIPFDEAKKMGALMFFGDKYGDKVNVVQFGDFSMEFCGGTHVKNSSEIGLFKIISESSIASGIRRIEAVTGLGVENYISSQIDHLKKSEEKIAELLDEKKKLDKELNELKLQSKLGQLDSVIRNPIDVNGIKVYKSKVDAESMDELKSFGDELRNKIKNGVGVLISVIED